MGAAAKHQMAPAVRAALHRALGIIEKEDGLTLSEMIALAIREHGIIFVLDKLSKYAERTGQIEVSGKVAHEHTDAGLSETARWIREVIGTGEAESPAEPGEERPLLPH